MAAPRMPLANMGETFPCIDYFCILLVIELLSRIEPKLIAHPKLMARLHLLQSLDRILSFLRIYDFVVISAE